MSNNLLWVAGAVGVVWLVSHGSRTPASHASLPGYAPSYSTPSTVSLPFRYGDTEDGDEREAHADEVRQAKQEFQDAADDLRTAVDALRYNRWDSQMSIIGSRLEDADDALGQLESLRPDDPAVQNARDEVDGMRSHISRLRYENWRTVRPALDSGSSAIEDEAESVSEEVDEE